MTKKVDNYKVEGIGVGRKNKIEGASGYKHQVDISFKDLTSHTLILIECKSWQRKIEIGQVLTFHSRILDIDKKSMLSSEGIMVTNKGYSKSAESYANFYGIKLQNVENEFKFCLFIANMLYLGLLDKVEFKDEVIVDKGE